MSKFTKWLPAPRPAPRRTFPKRLTRKWGFLIGEVISFIGTEFGFFGARTVGVTAEGNTILMLNKDYVLGRKGTPLQLPKDDVIFGVVKRHGFWELEESKFLARSLERACRKSTTQNVALIDIGANTGLVTLQAMNLLKTKAKAFCLNLFQGTLQQSRII